MVQNKGWTRWGRGCCVTPRDRRSVPAEEHLRNSWNGVSHVGIWRRTAPPIPHFGQGTGGMKTLSRRELVCPGPSGEGGRREVREVVGQDPVRTVALSQSETGHVDGVTQILAAVWEVDPGGRGPMEEAVCHPGRSNGAGTQVVAGAVREGSEKRHAWAPPRRPSVLPPFPSQAGKQE